MLRLRWPLLGLCALALVAPASAAPSARDAARDAQALADRIDYYLAARWQKDNVTPAALADDSEFVRRAYLDIAGRTPSVAEVRKFLKDPSHDKRRKLIDELLDGRAYVNHMTHVWRALLIPEADADDQVRGITIGFENWLHKQFEENVGYDKMVRQLVTLSFASDQDAMQAYQDAFNGGNGAVPVAFYMAKEWKPENLAAATSRLFLGARLECAQCHNHPFARWKREQFWGMAAFFAGIKVRNNQGVYSQPTRELTDRREIAIPNAKDSTPRVVQANFLDGTEPQWKFKVGPRVTLADWMTAKDNPYFARAGANRVWAHFFGVGIVDPVDDFNDDNKPSHPELLDELAKEFAAHDFDFKFLIRAITLSKAYQLTSAVTHQSQEDPRLFARMSVKGLTPEQLYDSLEQATGYRDRTPRSQRIYFDGSARAMFLSRFAAQDKRTEYHTSIPQALSLMNSSLISDMTSLERSATLGAVVESPFMDTPAKIETLFLAALARKPTAEESERLVKYVNDGGAAKDKKKALTDVFWAILNGPEFILNH